MKKTAWLYMFLLCLVTCKKGDVALNNNITTGSSGSIARFTVVGSTLYTVSHTRLNIFDLTDADHPVVNGSADIGMHIETIFSRNDTILFVGSQDGISIFDVKNRLLPELLSVYSHGTSCDPVVAGEDYAYLSLSSRQGSRCARTVNQLEVLSITDPRHPESVNVIPLVAPGGLALSSQGLFVCDNGIKWFDVSNPALPVLKKNYISIDATDLVATDSILIAIGDNGVTQYSIGSNNLVKLSTIPVVNK